MSAGFCRLSSVLRSFSSGLGKRRLLSAGPARFNTGCQERLCRPLLTGDVDRFGGVTVRELPDISEQEFSELLKESLREWRAEARVAVWLHVPISLSRLCSTAALHGFSFHHASAHEAVLSLWMGPGVDRLPAFATHQIGVAGAVVDESSAKVLVVQDRNKTKNMWKFPGGLSDLGENIGETAVREVLEETGVRSEFRSLLSLRQQHKQPGAFGMSDLYLICRLAPLSHSIHFCRHECVRCEWMDVSELAQSRHTTPITRRVSRLILHGLNNGFDSIDLSLTQMPSVHTGLVYQLYHRALTHTHAQTTASTLAVTEGDSDTQPIHQ